MMSDTLAIAILVAVPPTLAAVAVFIRSMRVHHHLEEIKEQFNGRTKALMQMREDDAFRRGMEAARRNDENP